MKQPAPKRKRPARKFIGFRIDIESRSGTDISAGAYKYAEDPDFHVLVIGYCPIYRYANGSEKFGAIRVLDQSDEDQVEQFARVLRDSRFQKHAFNANFERITLSKWLGMPNGTYLDPENWHCTAIKANVSGVFGTLSDVAKAVRSPVKKDSEGRRLIKLFSLPDKKTGQFHEPDNSGLGACWCGAVHWQDFKMFEDYCKNDVLTEAVAGGAFPPIPEDVQAQYEADQRINDRGIRHFKGLSERAVEQVEIERDRLMAELKYRTGLDNPNSNQQMQRWLEAMDYPMTSLDKAHREEAAADPLCPDEVLEVLDLKGRASLSSVSKHKAALKSRCEDGRIRGSLQFYGAHTGREAGRVFQPQNMPTATATDKERAKLLAGTAGSDAPTIAKGTVRASLVPARGHVFVTCDYNAIEARVLAGLAGEKAAEAEFRGAGKIYELTASQMFGLDKERLVEDLKRCGKCGDKENCAACAYRAKGKVSDLALGYAGGAGALVTMGAEAAGIDIGNYKELNAEWKSLGMPGKFHEWNREAHDYPELLRMRDLFRESRPMTTRFWKQCARAWDVASNGQAAKFGQHQCLTMMRDGRHNRLVLPSGRSIWYRFARSHPSDTRPDHIERRTFMGKSVGVGHVRTDTHGGKLTENVTQAVARDILFDLLMRIEAQTAAGWPARTVLHVHDEVVLEVPVKHAEQVLADTVGMMSVAPSWGKFFVVKGEGKIMERYGK
jgi:DNA polymerase